MAPPTMQTGNSAPASKRRHGTESLTRDDIPNIVATVLKALPNTPIHSTMANANQPANPPAVAVTNPPVSEEEQQHQELGES